MADDNKDQGSDLTKAIEALLGKNNNDSAAAINTLMKENFKLREDKRDLRQKLDEAGKAVPAEGSVILSKADGERWKAYLELGKHEDLKAAVSERDILKKEVAVAKRDELLRSVAEVEGWDPEVMKTLAGDLNFEIVEIKDDKGESRKGAMVLVKSGDQIEKKAAAEYAEGQWKKFLPSLKVSGGQQQQPTPPGVKFVRQPGAHSLPPATKDEVIKQERTNLINSGDYAGF